MWAWFYLRNIALKFVSLGLFLLSRNNVCKTDSVFQAASFGDLLLNEKQKKPFVWLKDEVTITQWFLAAASLAQVDKRWTKLNWICFVVTLEGSIRGRWNLFFFSFCFSSFKNLLRVFVAELPFKPVGIWMICFFSCHCALLARKAITHSQSRLTC